VRLRRNVSRPRFTARSADLAHRLRISELGFRRRHRADRPAQVRAGRLSAFVLPGGAGDVRRDDVGGVPVQGRAGPVIAHRGSRVRVRGGFLHVSQRDPCVQGGVDERVPQGVRPDVLGDPGAARDPADDAPGAVPVESAAFGGEEDRSVAAFPDSEVDRAGGPRGERDGDDLAALTGDGQRAVAAFQAVASISAPVASDTRSPFSASSEISACSAADPRPAATGRAPTSLRSRRSGRTRRSCTACASLSRGPGPWPPDRARSTRCQGGGRRTGARRAGGTRLRTGAGPARTPRGSGPCNRPETRLMPSRSVPVNTGTVAARAVEAAAVAVVVIGHLRVWLRPGSLGRPGPQRRLHRHGKTPKAVTPGHKAAGNCRSRASDRRL
jgi:hypothetical protein